MTNFYKSPTLRDVANASGVSISTVSKIFLGQTGNFKPSTVEKVKAVAAELNYVPNALARGMVTGTNSKVVGFFVPNITNTFYVEMVTHLENQLGKAGYLLTLCLFQEDPELMSKYLKFLIEIRASGAIFGSCRIPECTDDFASAHEYLSMVAVQSDIDNIDRVDINDEQATFEMVDYLIKKGHRNIGFVGYRYDMTIMNARLNGYKRALESNGIPVRPEYIGDGKHSEASGRAQTEKILNLREPPTAIHCANELMAQSAAQALQLHGLRIPEDISLTGFDNTSLARTLNPALTTMEQPIGDMAQAAVNLLLDQINGRSSATTPKHVFLPHRLVERKSVAALEH